MIIKAGNYTRVRSDAEMLLAIALFTAAGFPFQDLQVEVRKPNSAWRLCRHIEGEDLYVFASRDGDCTLAYLDDVRKEGPSVEVYLPAPETLLQRYVHSS